MDAVRVRKILAGNPWEGDLVDIIKYAPDRERAIAWTRLKERCLESPTNDDLVECIWDITSGGKVVPKLYQYKAKRFLIRLGRWIFKG